MELNVFINSLVAIIFAYICGSIPWGYIIGKVNGIDIRTVGSKNIGATNVTRCVGKKAGKLCFALDFLKGLLPVLLAQYLAKRGLTGGEITTLIVVFATIIGHIFPVFLNFKGGKGVSTAAGAIMALAPYALITALAVWVVVFLVSRYVSLASITAAAVLPVVQWIFVLTQGKNWLVATILTIIAALAIFRHRSNIQRLLDGTENRFGKK
ncbi:MAG: glycerol-3-phosphate 1-O-acyltransferase PlsY [Lentisphaeria bacterium]|nr:glycerol-3-phosphate 1-O-acyltransferase PlsY [Lentisphaeria bacterium]